MEVRKLIFTYVDQHCEMNQICKIDLQKIILFKWDRVYIFQHGIRRDIENEINIPYPNYIDSTTDKFLMIRNHQILYLGETFLTLIGQSQLQKNWFLYLIRLINFITTI